MKLLVAIMLVTIAMCNAEPPRFGQLQFQRQTAGDSAPYAPRGWRPQGAAFGLPSQQKYGAPPQTYGPPSTEEATTTEQPETTEIETETEASTEPTQADSERLSDSSASRRQSGKLENADANPVFLVVPKQRNNFVYTFRRSAPLAAAPRAVFLTSPAELRALPIASTSSIYTPYASYIQIYQ